MILWTCDLDRDLWPTFEKLNIGHIFFILRDSAFIFGMRVPYDIRPFQQYHKFWTCDLDRDLWPTFKKLNIGHNLFVRRDRAFIFYTCSLWQGLSYGTINFEHVILTVTFDLLLKNFNIGHTFFILRDKAFIYCMSVPYDKAFPRPLTYFSKTVTLTISFVPIGRVFIFGTCSLWHGLSDSTINFDLHLDFWPNFEHLP